MSRTVEIVVGLFLIAGFAAFAFLAIQVSGLNPTATQGDTYTLVARFNNVAGLNQGARVTVAGVQVGRVAAIRLDPLSVRAEVEMQINDRIDYLTDDSIAAIQTSGILGEKYIAISVGGSPDILGDGDRIRETQSALVLEELVGKFLSNMVNK